MAQVFGVVASKSSDAVSILATVLLAIFLLSLLNSRASQLDKDEPPLAKSSIPFIGNLLDMMRYDAGTLMQSRFPVSRPPIFSLKIFSTRIYVVASLEVAQAALGETKSLSFNSLLALGTERVWNLGTEVTQLFNPNDEWDAPLFKDSLHVMSRSMAPGSSLKEMHYRALKSMATNMNKVGQTTQSTGLLKWLREFIFMANSIAIYGPRNPVVDDPSLVNSLLEFEGDLPKLVLNFFQPLTAAKGYQARKRFSKAFQNWYADGHLDQAGDVVKRQFGSNCTKHGLPTNTQADLEISVLMAGDTNTVPIAFWLSSHIFADAELLQDIREEILHVTKRLTVDGTEMATINFPSLLTECRTLNSAWLETLRRYNVGLSVRMVREDMVLNSTFLLKKNSMLEIPHALIHRNPEVWGDDALAFKARRFLDKQNTTGKRKKAMMPFGAGTHLCPGRHYVTGVILSLVAMMIVGFEVTGAEDGTIRIPKQKPLRMTSLGTKPASDIEVVIKRRKGWENVQFTFDIGGGAMLEGVDE